MGISSEIQILKEVFDYNQIIEYSFEPWLEVTSAISAIRVDPEVLETSQLVSLQQKT